jgi:hypothetical protein
MARPAVRDSPGKHANVRAARSFTRVLGRTDGVRVRVSVPRRLTGPLPSQSIVGTATVLDNGRPIARIPLVLGRALPAVSGLTVAARFVTKPLMLLVIAVAAVAVAALAGMARRRRRQRLHGKLEAA